MPLNDLPCAALDTSSVENALSGMSLICCSRSRLHCATSGRRALIRIWEQFGNNSALGRRDAALDAIVRAGRLSGGSHMAIAARGHVLATMGREREVREVLRTLEYGSAERYVPPTGLALVYAGLGERARAFEWLEKAYTKQDVNLVFLPVDPRWDAYRDDPRFVDLVARCGFRRAVRLNCARTVPAAIRGAPNPANATHDEHERLIDLFRSARVSCAENAGPQSRENHRGWPCKASIPGSNPGGASKIRLVYSGYMGDGSEDMGNTVGPNGILDRFQPTRLVVKVSQVVVHEGDEPDALVDGEL
jgi:hypothetical protein